MYGVYFIETTIIYVLFLELSIPYLLQIKFFFPNIFIEEDSKFVTYFRGNEMITALTPFIKGKDKQTNKTHNTKTLKSTKKMDSKFKIRSSCFLLETCRLHFNEEIVDVQNTKRSSIPK